MIPRMNTPASSITRTPLITFIGGGNMAGALIGGLVRGGTPADGWAIS